MLETQVNLLQLESDLQNVIDSQTNFNLNGLQPQSFIEIETLLLSIKNVFAKVRVLVAIYIVMYFQILENRKILTI